LKTASAPPYLLPTEDAIVEHPWVDADGRPLGDRLEHWDPFTNTELFRVLDLDLDAVRRECRLSVDSAFALDATWYSNRTRLSGSGPSIELGHLRGVIRAPLSLVIPGESAGGRVSIRTALVLRHPGQTVSPISPRREGAILWIDSTDLTLEGASARFPITALDFAAVGRLPDTASWSLDWDPQQLDGPVLGDLQLLLNSRDETLLTAVRSGVVDARAAVTRSFLMFDVARALVEGALGNERFVQDPETFEEGTIGRMLFELLSMCWPGVPIETLASRRRSDPMRLEAELQAHLGMFK
jgi:hypothetical protein